MPSLFTDKAAPPDEVSLRKALGKAHHAWETILADAQTRGPGLALQWKFYGEKHGWQLKVALGKRALVYLIPGKGNFTAALALNERAVAGLDRSGLPAPLVRDIEQAKVYVEGRPARIEVRGAAEAAIVKRLMDLKLATA